MKFNRYSLLPKSLYGRFLLMIILPMLVVQLVAVYVFYERHWESMRRNLSASLSGEIAAVVQLYEQGKVTEEAQEIANRYLNLQMAVVPLPKQNNNTTPDIFTRCLEKQGICPHAEGDDEHPMLIEALSQGLPVPFRLLHAEDNYLRLILATETHRFDFRIPEKRLANPTTYIFILWLVGTATVLSLVSLLFLRGQIRSIVRLARAADEFGKGRDLPSFIPQGAREVRQAAIAFIQMRERIKRLLTRRVEMLADVSSDLTAPLEKMRVALSGMRQTEQVRKLTAEVDSMEKMLQGYLSFTRNRHAEPSVEIPLSLFFERILRDYQHRSGTITCHITTTQAIHARPAALRHAVGNVLDNALLYGKRVVITVTGDITQVVLTIEDDGHGIPPDKRELAFEPFKKLHDPAGDVQQGIGLGLTAARDIIHSHGGEITLESSQTLGGLKVVMTLPV